MVRLVSSFALAILLLLLATLGDTYNHYYRIHGKIICPRKWFWYEVSLKELDGPSSHDLFGYTRMDSFYPHYYDHKWLGENSDEFLSATYDLKVTFTHTCTPTGKTSTKEWQFKRKIESNEKTYDLPQDLNL